MTKEKFKELLNLISTDTSLIDETIPFEGNTYSFLFIEGDDDWSGGGKYQSQTSVFQLVKLSPNETYINKKNNNYTECDFYVKENGTRTGSYYTDYYCDYSRKIVEKKVTHIPEHTIVVPAKDVVEFVDEGSGVKE